MRRRTWTRGRVSVLAAVPALAFTVLRADGPSSTPYENTCAACHQLDGSGLAGLYPKLKGDPIVSGDPQLFLRVIMAGPALVLPKNRPHYSLFMPPFEGLSDEQIAAIATYVRFEFGNGASAVATSQVAAARTTLPK